MTTEPKLFTLAEAQDRFGDTFTAELRERGLIAEEPVDPLLIEARALADNWWPNEDALKGSMDGSMWMERILAALRRGIELAPRKELTREMVLEIVKVALHESRAVVEYDDFLPGSPVGPAREADDFVKRLYCRLTEALQ